MLCDSKQKKIMDDKNVTKYEFITIHLCMVCAMVGISSLTLRLKLGLGF